MAGPAAFIGDFWRFLRATPRAANLFALATLALWVAKAVWLDDLPPAFAKAHELGKVVDGVLSAIIAGWVFYLFFALLPEFRQKIIVAPFILKKVATIVGDCRGVLHEIEKASSETLPFSRLTENELGDALTKIPFHSETTMVLGSGQQRASWLQLFNYRRERSKASIGQIFAQGQYLEAELAALLLRISDSPFFGMAAGMEGYATRITNPDLSVFTNSFHRYLVDCRALAAWHDAHCRPPNGPILME